MSHLKIEAVIDSTNSDQIEAAIVFLNALKGEAEETPKPKARKTRSKKTPKPAPAPEPEVEEEDETPEPETTDIKIEDVRSLLAEKVTDNREAVVKKLKSLGAKNVTSLEKSKYQEFVDFLNGLD